MLGGRSAQKRRTLTAGGVRSRQGFALAQRGADELLQREKRGTHINTAVGQKGRTEKSRHRKNKRQEKKTSEKKTTQRSKEKEKKKGSGVARRGNHVCVKKQYRPDGLKKKRFVEQEKDTEKDSERRKSRHASQVREKRAGGKRDEAAPEVEAGRGGVQTDGSTEGQP